MCLSRERDNMMMVTPGRQNCVIRKNHMIYFISAFWYVVEHINDVTLMTSNWYYVVKWKRGKVSLVYAFAFLFCSCMTDANVA